MCSLTSPVGFAMAELPLPPPIARAVVAGGAAGCGAEMVALAALLSVASLWVGASDRRRALQDAKLKWASPFPDQLQKLADHMPTSDALCCRHAA